MSHPTKPYMIRAIHAWCVDNNLTPHIQVAVDKDVRVPMHHVKNNEIVLNISMAATPDLLIENEALYFSARFSGKSFPLVIPMDNIISIFARENQEGVMFGKTQKTPKSNIKLVEPEVKKKRPKFSIVK